jgi:hypothetical protein
MQISTRIAALLPLLAAAPGSAASFTKIADATTFGPGWTPESTTFGVPAVDAGVVAFVAGGTTPTGDHGVGIYTGSGGSLTTVADNTTLVPGSTFAWFYAPSISAGNVAFVANDSTY